MMVKESKDVPGSIFEGKDELVKTEEGRRG